MYEIGRLVGIGDRAVFFKLRNHASLGIKISFFYEGRDAKIMLEKELNKARILKKLGVSIPDYVNVLEIEIPENIEMLLENAKKNTPDIHWSYYYLKDFLIDHKGKKLWGLIMEYIEDDVFMLQKTGFSLISKRRLEYIYKIERKKIEDLGIIIKDSDTNLNILWSEAKAKLYFIDFEHWDMSKIKV